MHVLLINPPAWTISGKRVELVRLPLGLLYLAAVLEESGHTVRVIDTQALCYGQVEIKHLLTSQRPEVIGVTSTTYSYPALKKTVRIAREVLPDSKVVIGGVHVTADPNSCLLENPQVDVAVLGEGEKTITELINAFERGASLTKIGGIGYRENEEIKFTKPREPIEDLNGLPFPAWHLLEPELTRYRGPAWKGPTGIALPYCETVSMWSRGCPHRCVFCSNPVFGHQRIRFRSPKNIVDEIELLHEKYKVRSLFVCDDELIGANDYQNRWISNICDEIIKRGLNDVKYDVQGRCSRWIRRETLEKMKKTGFEVIRWGVESGSKKVLDAIKKDIAVDYVKKVFALCREVSLKTYAFIMVGNLYETREDVKLTIRLLEELRPDYVQVNVVTPYPGSELWNIAIERDWIETKEFSKYDGTNLVFHTDLMSAKEMKQMATMIKASVSIKTIGWLRLLEESFTTTEGLKRVPRRASTLIRYILAKIMAAHR